MIKFLDEIVNHFQTKPQVLQELIEPENRIPEDEETNTASKSDNKKESVQEN